VRLQKGKDDAQMFFHKERLKIENKYDILWMENNRKDDIRLSLERERIRLRKRPGCAEY
jgi:hypothetical protein